MHCIATGLASRRAFLQRARCTPSLRLWGARSSSVHAAQRTVASCIAQPIKPALACSWNVAPCIRLAFACAGMAHAPRHRRATQLRTSSSQGSSSQANADGYWTLESCHRTELEVKKSRFITYAWPASSAQQALQLVEQQRDPSASHNCWAFVTAATQRSTDDGEPSGTAGRPILSAIHAEGLQDVCVLVIRFYGGIKLGSGGLVRAYGGAARACLQAAPRLFVKQQVLLQVVCPYDKTGLMFNSLDKCGGCCESEQYEGDRLVLVVRVDANAQQQFVEMVANGSGGQVVPQVVAADAGGMDSR